MKLITKKDLGKKIGTTYVVGLFSFSVYEKGYTIKLCKQELIILDKETASCLYNHMATVFNETLIEREI